MLKKLIITALAVFSTLLLVAKYAELDDFIIGGYTYWRASGGLYSAPVFYDLQNCGYNSAVVNAYAPDNDLSGFLYGLDLHGQDALIIDKAWDPRPSNTSIQGVEGLSLSNFQHYEAEFSSMFDPVPETGREDKYYYCSLQSDRVGGSISAAASGGKVWKCDRNLQSAGYAINDLKYRFSNANGNFPYLTEEFFFHNSWDTQINNYMLLNDYLDFKVAFKLSEYNRDISHPINLLKFEICGRPWVITPNSTYISTSTVTIPHSNSATSEYAYETILTQYRYETPDLDIPEQPINYGNKIIRLRVSRQDLMNAGMLLYQGGRWVLSNIYPKIWWFGNSNLLLDYIEVEDNSHQELIANQTQNATKVNNRLDNLQLAATQNNLSRVLSFDEPNQPQFDSYYRVQNMITADNPGMFTAIYDRKNDLKKNNNPQSAEDYYQHPKAFIDATNPKLLAVDIYPIRPEVAWNPTDVTTEHPFVQVKLDKMLENYRYYAEQRQSHPDMDFVAIVQSFGKWDRRTASPHWSSWLRPPYQTQKMLQYLPLCYGADGIINYRTTAFNKTSYTSTDNLDYDYAPVNVDMTLQDPAGFPLISKTSNYYALNSANSKIKVIGPIMKHLQWQGADCLRIGLNPTELNLQTLLLDDLQINDPNNGIYEGYIQCGAYLNSSNEPSFMLVNRRANYQLNNTTPYTTENSYLDNCFTSFQPQTIVFNYSDAAETGSSFGTKVGLFDPYTQILYCSTNQIINIPLDAGDGIYLQMVATPPTTVTNSITVHKNSIINGVVTVASGGILNFASDAKVTLLNNSKIVVESGGQLNINHSQCIFGQDASIEVNGGTLNIEGSTIYKKQNATEWSGIVATSSSNIILSNSSFSGARVNSVSNSNLLISNCRFDVPANSYGLIIDNRNPGFTTQIINSIPYKGFFGSSNSTSKGVVLGTIKNKVIIHNVNFANLVAGIWKLSNVSKMDSIAYCHFLSCSEGLKVISSNYTPKIEHCSFVSNTVGMRLTAATPYINECDFINGTKGIITEYSLTPEIWFKNGVFNSNFTNVDTAIESRGSDHRIENCYFNLNNKGIVNHAKSNLNLGWSANDVFNNELSNIVFFDEQPYEATIQVFKGHNDFYHYQDNQTGTTANDFSFDENYYNNLWNPEHRIDVSRNWFQNFDVRINDPHYNDYIFIDSFDPANNMPAPPPNEEDRYYSALNYESQGIYSQAFDLFKAILNNPLPEEKRYLPSAADGIYRLSYFKTDPSWSKSGYFDSKAIQYAVDDPKLVALLKDYLAKSYIEDKEYQNAINLIQLRIDNPISEVDSLLAVLDLEIVLQLYSMEEDKAPINTKYMQYKYADVQAFNTHHEEHWNQLYKLLSENEVIDPNTPVKPLITSNYPNPFNPSTTIAYYIPVKSKVDMTIYNIKGQRVKNLINNEIPKGNHKVIWDGKDNNGLAVSSGIYLVRIGIGDKVDTHKVIMLK
ncbi:MAG: T9SS type A sorting domain-containing protein [Candidatus Cloacimonadaceae bacterium]